MKGYDYLKSESFETKRYEKIFSSNERIDIDIFLKNNPKYKAIYIRRASFYGDESIRIKEDGQALKIYIQLYVNAYLCIRG